ncbi:MAG: P-II family nitrogen regulator [Methanomicrobia archaeon]|nr:P-II family nitrogen regulator [Methanomicrobia archaeon]
MKKIEAVIRPERLEQVKVAMEMQGQVAMTITEVTGRGEQKGIALQFRGRRMEVDTLPKVKIETIVKDELVESLVYAISNAARTGKFGDGKIFVSSLDDIIRVRTGEQGEKAL